VDFPDPVSSLAGAEFIANDRPILASYKGEILLPVLVDYPEDRSSAAFWHCTDFRDPFIQEEIEGQWLDDLAADPLLLPTVNLLPTRRPPPAFLLSREDCACKRYPDSRAWIRCVWGNMNWLGTDDQAAT
jgi:microcin C transport system permease protein